MESGKRGPNNKSNPITTKQPKWVWVKPKFKKEGMFRFLDKVVVRGGKQNYKKRFAV